MDTSVDGNYNLNEAIWTVDLAGVTSANLNFYHAEWNDETDVLPASFAGSSNGDGVAISADENKLVYRADGYGSGHRHMGICFN